MIVTRDKQDKQQPEFHLNDEKRAVALAWPKCPYCGERPKIWRLPTRKGIFFQVWCPNARRHPGKFKNAYPNASGKYWFCHQGPIPADPVKDSKAAVQAWRVYCAVMKDV